MKIFILSTIIVFSIFITTNVFAENTAIWNEYTSDNQITSVQKNIDNIGLCNMRYCNFKNGDYYYSHQIDCLNSNTYFDSVTIKGSTFSARYYDKNKSEWIQLTDISEIPSEPHLYIIDTDETSIIMSSPSIYNFDNIHKTKVPLRMSPIKVVKISDGYTISYTQNLNKGEILDFWYIKSEENLIPFQEKHLNQISVHDLDGEKRWCYDGYYFKSPTNYMPYRKNMMYKHPSSYVGVSWTKYADCRGLIDFAYIMLVTCAYNQNESGFWNMYHTVDWLNSDFGIGAGYYDTRFNTDFAEGLVYGCKKFGDKYLIETLNNYMNYFYNYANNNNYVTKNGGILVADYGPSKVKTHSSLNHQLAELNLLYEYYNFTKNNDYLLLANKMLRGIQDTKDYWVMPNKNLRYAYGYTGTANTMKDYPYLTYNDLFVTKKLLQEYFNTSDKTIEYLMENKKIYMDRNGITEYRKK